MVEQYIQKQRMYRGGFALPTVLIASVVLLTILVVSVSSVSAVRTSLKMQYYEQLAKAAGEAGVAYAKACLAKSGNVPQWSNEKPLTPASDCEGNQTLEPVIEVLVVAGGGGGGAGIGGGGGGGGVVRATVTPEATYYSVTVGAGGAGGVSTAAGANGGNSQFGSVIAVGGGGGAGRIGSAPAFNPAQNGGSGGGGTGTYNTATSAPSAGASGVPGQGHAGGSGSAGSDSSYAGNGGGGGGAGAPGSNASGTAESQGTSGNGGIGVFSDISGQHIYYGAGGSGGRWGTGTVGERGLTGGGTGGQGNATAGTAGQPNTGGGGGGGSSGAGNGGAGGSGIVVIRYVNNGSITVNSGTPPTYTRGIYNIHVYPSNAPFVVDSLSTTSSCPSDPRCSVVATDAYRSSFSVGAPTLDAAGKAVSIPQTGYVELLRTSTGAVWRTYRQPATQVASVPDLCSGAAATGLGWNNAVLTSQQAGLPNAPSARAISVAAGNAHAGRMFFRKDFSINTAGTYTISVQSPSDNDLAQVYIDGTLRTTTSGKLTTSTVSLSAGCHTIAIRLTNLTVDARPSHVIAAVHLPGAEPIVATDSTWRASSGMATHLSTNDYYADPSIWVGTSNTGSSANSTITNWNSLAYINAEVIRGACASACPASSHTYFRAQFTTPVSSDNMQLTAACDDACDIFIDGTHIVSAPFDPVQRQRFSLPSGTHTIGVRLLNSSGPDMARFTFTIYDIANSAVRYITETSTMKTVNEWTATVGTPADPHSYEASFRPTPLDMPNW